MPEKRLTRKQVAERLNLSSCTIRNWCRASVSGQPSKLDGVDRDRRGHFRIPLKSVERLEREYVKCGGFVL